MTIASGTDRKATELAERSALGQLVQIALPGSVAAYLIDKGGNAECLMGCGDAAKVAAWDDAVTATLKASLTPDTPHNSGTLASGEIYHARAAVASGGAAFGAVIVIMPGPAVGTTASDSQETAAAMQSLALAAANLLALRAASAGQASLRAELDLLYRLEEDLQEGSRRHAGLAELLGQSGRFLGVGYSVLLLPAKRIRISATHAAWKSVDRRAIDRYIVESVMPQLRGADEPVSYRFNLASIQGAGDSEVPALLSPLIDARGNVEGVIAQLGRVTGDGFDDVHKRLMAHIMRKVQYVIERSFDPMTGLMNRAGFEGQLRETIAATNADDSRHQVVYFDLDNLQLVNDSFGRDAGDQVIMRFAQLLERALPRNAIASRLTGDDFAVLLTQATLDDALALANGVRAESDQLRYLEGSTSLQISVSVGIAAIEPDGDAGGVLTAARIACDKAKDHGRDRIEIHDQDDQSIVRRYDDMHLVTRLHRATANDEFMLMAQPIVPAQSPGQAARFEILLRMTDAADDPITAGPLIAAAERYHLMPHIDRWVVSRALAILGPVAKRLKESGCAFAINLSGQSLGDDQMLDFIETQVEAAGIPPGFIVFEITESAAVANLEKAQSFIARLRKRGLGFSLDDFGSGLSSFAYLKNLAVDTLKIDGGFIQDIQSDRISRSMVAAITQVAAVMGLKTVAEYVGDEENQALLRDLGVDYLQGHGVGRPVPLAGVLDDLARQDRAAG